MSFFSILFMCMTQILFLFFTACLHHTLLPRECGPTHGTLADRTLGAGCIHLAENVNIIQHGLSPLGGGEGGLSIIKLLCC